MYNDNLIKVSYRITFQSDLMFLKRRIKKWKIKWDSGILQNGQTGKELLYFHFILSKSSKKFNVDLFNKNTRAFIIQSSGIKKER